MGGSRRDTSRNRAPAADDADPSETTLRRGRAYCTMDRRFHMAPIFFAAALTAMSWASFRECSPNSMMGIASMSCFTLVFRPGPSDDWSSKALVGEMDGDRSPPGLADLDFRR